MKNQVWLITGSSRGLGRALAEGVLAAGHKLVATARNPKQLSPLVERYGDQVRAVALVLPGMRARTQGTIVNVSSMDGIASLPVNGFYSSSKFALEGLTESLWQEIEPICLRAFLVEPGSFRTGLADRTKF